MDLLTDVLDLGRGTDIRYRAWEDDEAAEESPLHVVTEALTVNCPLCGALEGSDCVDIEEGYLVGVEFAIRGPHDERLEFMVPDPRR